MKPCPFCREQIQEEAIKCRYCDSMLVHVSANTSEQIEDKKHVKYIVDRDLVRFGKFAVGLLGIFLIVGAYLYGVKLENIYERFEAAKDNLAKIENQIAKDQSKIKETNQGLQLKLLEANKQIDKVTKSFKQRAEETANALDLLRENFEGSIQLTNDIIQLELISKEKDPSGKLAMVDFNDGKVTIKEIISMAEIRDTLLEIKPLVEAVLAIAPDQITNKSPSLQKYYCINLKRAFSFYDSVSGIFSIKVMEHQANFPDNAPPLGITLSEARNIRRLDGSLPDICD